MAARVSPFQPIGDRARWRVIYDLLRDTPVGGVLRYEDMGTALGLDPETDRHVIQMAMRRAAREHEVCDKRTVESVANEGYRIVQTPEKLRLAERDRRKSGRSLARGSSKVVNVDLSGVEPETRHAFEVVARAFAMQMEFNRRFDVRQKRLEKAVDDMSQRTERTEERTERTEEEIADLKARLARLEGEET